MTRSKSTILTVLRYAVPALLIVATVLWLCFIYSNSLKSGAESSEQSGKVHEIVNDVADSVGYDKPISEKFVRKSAHFTEFSVLGFLICLDLWAFGILSHRKKLYISLLWALTAIPVSALFATIDELLQNVSENRGPSVTDVLIDTSGALVATAVFIGIFALFTIIIRARKNKSIQYSNSLRK